MLRHFQMFAAYNAWANGRLYAAAALLPEADYRRDTGAFFGSIHRTLNNLLVADRIWQKRFTGLGEAPTGLEAVLFDDLPSLTTARQQEDQRLITWLAGLTEAEMQRVISYTPVSVPIPIAQPLAPTLAHLFNHQTHHRGQVHMMLTMMGQPSVVLDMSAFLREPGSAAWI